jgi:predicted transcriptional regulator
MRKSTVIDIISKLPEEISVDEIIERLIVLEKIERGQRQVKEGQVNTEDEAKAKLAKWLD